MLKQKVELVDFAFPSLSSPPKLFIFLGYGKWNRFGNMGQDFE